MPKIHKRLRNLNNFETRVNWVAGGGAALLALLALGSSGTPRAPQLLSSLVITLVVVAAGLLAYARTNFEWAISKIEVELESDPSIQGGHDLTSLPEEARKWPTNAEVAYNAALALIVIAMLLFLLRTWWWLFSC